jgi:hypothetical protein
MEELVGVIWRAMGHRECALRDPTRIGDLIHALTATRPKPEPPQEKGPGHVIRPLLGACWQLEPRLGRELEP